MTTDENAYPETGDDPVTAADVPGVNQGHSLREYWVHGKGALKIRWGQPGDFKRCVRQLRKYSKGGTEFNTEGLCSNMHKEALGVRPGQEHGKGHTSLSGEDLIRFNTLHHRDQGKFASRPGAHYLAGYMDLDRHGALTAAEHESLYGDVYDNQRVSTMDDAAETDWGKELGLTGGTDSSRGLYVGVFGHSDENTEGQIYAEVGDGDTMIVAIDGLDAEAMRGLSDAIFNMHNEDFEAEFDDMQEQHGEERLDPNESVLDEEETGDFLVQRTGGGAIRILPADDPETVLLEIPEQDAGAMWGALDDMASSLEDIEGDTEGDTGQAPVAAAGYSDLLEEITGDDYNDMYAAIEPVEEAVPEMLPGEMWHAVAHVEGVSTGTRIWDAGAITWREPPFAFHTEVQSSAHGSPMTTVQVGLVTRMARLGSAIHAWGNVDLDSELGAETGRRIVDRFARWVSMDPCEGVGYQLQMPEDGAWTDGSPEPDQVVFNRYKIAGLTSVSLPAQEGSYLEPLPELVDAIAAMYSSGDGDGDWDGWEAGEEPAEEMVTASAVNVCTCMGQDGKPVHHGRCDLKKPEVLRGAKKAARLREMLSEHEAGLPKSRLQWNRADRQKADALEKGIKIADLDAELDDMTRRLPPSRISWSRKDRLRARDIEAQIAELSGSKKASTGIEVGDMDEVSVNLCTCTGEDGLPTHHGRCRLGAVAKAAKKAVKSAKGGGKGGGEESDAVKRARAGAARVKQKVAEADARKAGKPKAAKKAAPEPPTPMTPEEAQAFLKKSQARARERIAAEKEAEAKKDPNRPFKDEKLDINAAEARRGLAALEKRNGKDRSSKRWNSPDLRAAQRFDEAIFRETPEGMLEHDQAWLARAEDKLARANGELGTDRSKWPKQYQEEVVVLEGQIEELKNRVEERKAAVKKAKAKMSTGVVVAAGTHVLELSDLPPAWWFEEPAENEAEPGGPIHITDEGRVYGWLVPEKIAHRSYARAGVRKEYTSLNPDKIDFTRWWGETIVEGGQRVLAGPITMECPHAPTSGYDSLAARNSHYENTCSIVGKVATGVGTNHKGQWIAGALMPGITAEQFTKILLSRMSGDWQPHPERPGWQEFVAALVVPVGGWPGSRTAITTASIGPVYQMEEDEEGEVRVASCSVPIVAAAGCGCNAEHEDDEVEVEEDDEDEEVEVEDDEEEVEVDDNTSITDTTDTDLDVIDPMIVDMFAAELELDTRSRLLAYTSVLGM